MVSAIITTYKRPPEIVKRAAQSVLGQTYKDIELIIVDDSPSSYELREDVRKMAESLGRRVRYIQHEKNMGACAARNTGIRNARGEFIAFLDDDDEWLANKIQLQTEEMNKNPEISLVYCGWYIFYAEENRVVKPKVKFHKGYIYKKLIMDNFIGSTSFPLIRKSVFEEIGCFNVEMKAAQDYEMWLRIVRKYAVSYVKEPLVRYYVHEGEQITKNYRAKLEALERVNELNMGYLKKHPKAYSIRIMKLLLFYVKFDIKKARKYYWKAVKLYPIPTVYLLRAFKWIYIMPFLQRR